MVNNNTIELVVLGEPQAQKRPRFQHKDSKGKALPFVHTYDPSRKDKYNFRQVIQESAPEQPYRCPLRVDCYFYFGYRKGDFRTGKHAGELKENAPLWKPTGKDRDNLDKFVLDALTGIFFVNDSQVVDGRIIKQYAINPRTIITITPLAP